MNAPLLIAAILLIAAVYVLLPVAVAAFTYYRARRGVRCPLTGTDAEVQVDAPRAAAGEVVGRRSIGVKACSLWPRPDCRQACAGRL